MCLEINLGFNYFFKISKVSLQSSRFTENKDLAMEQSDFINTTPIQMKVKQELLNINI